MQEFDPRRPTFRIAPRALMVAAGVAALALGVRLSDAQATLATPEMRAAEAAKLATLQHAAFTASVAQPGLHAAEPIEIRVQSGESFENAIRRTGVDANDAKAAAALFDAATLPVKNLHGRTFEAFVAKPIDELGELRLVGLSMRTGPADQFSISRAYDGSLRLRQMSEEITEEVAVVQGEIGNSLSKTVGQMGVPASVVDQAKRVMAQRLDFSRDVNADDTFKLVVRRKITESGRTVGGAELLYAEVNAAEKGGKPIRFYRFTPPGEKQSQFFDDQGKNMRGFLLATPLAVARITSSYGMRKHPVLGYNKMHQGIDFGAGTGTPIFAAGDGVIVQAGRNGGYGNWVQIRHAEGWETGYAHMSRFASGTKRGVRVKQGQLIGYVGATGRVTGPHLHYEVMRNGAKMNPRNAKIPSGVTLEGSALAAFKTEMGLVDTQLAQAENPGATRVAAEEAAAAKATTVALRPTIGLTK
jgi:murein DD-endopeptidase MepM/ murein hydrolase activator NlpD